MANAGYSSLLPGRIALLQTFHLLLTITEPHTTHVRIAKDCLLGAMVLYLDCISVEEYWEVYSVKVVRARENNTLLKHSRQSTAVLGKAAAVPGGGEGLSY